MLVSTKGRYALRILLELGRYDNQTHVPLPMIAAKQGISEKYLESIVSLLVKSGMVSGVRGKGGGYSLARPLEEYSVGEVLRLTEGSLAPVSCLEEEENLCPRAGDCATLPIWEGLDAMINEYLDSIKLSQLAAMQGENPCPGGCIR
ncbi:MAG: Rrf2 family transcriptional regulator [Firmicutes bacterium]|nr:Rrf2 family transcriptional regulator [Bacillota bacterium]